MQEGQKVMVWFEGESFTYELFSYEIYGQLMQYVALNIFNLPQAYNLVEMDKDDIPIKKVTSDKDLKSIIQKCKQTFDMPQLTILSADIQCHDFAFGDLYDDQITRKLEKKDLQGLFKDLATIKANVDKQIQNEVINFFLGITGGGKSTLVNHCQGIQLKCQKAGSSFHIFPIIPQYLYNVKVAEIGNDFQSCTSLPGYYKSANGQIICDLAGFIDTKGSKQQIRNSYSNSQIFKAQSLVRIILIVQESVIDGGRGGTFVQTLKMIKRLFPHDKQIQKCSGIIVTKVKSDSQKSDIIDNISNICVQNNNLNSNEKQYLNAIVASKRIAIFRLPKKIDKDNYEIKFEENILQFISSIPIISLQSDAKISLTQKSRLQIIDMIKNIEDMIQDEAEKLLLSYPTSHDFEPEKEALDVYCTNIDEGMKKILPFFPYDIDMLIEACRIIGLKINYQEFQSRIGSLIKNLRRCRDLIPDYKFRTNLFDSFLFYLQQKHKKFFYKMNNLFDRQELKDIAIEQKKRQDENSTYLAKRQKQILDNMNRQSQFNRQKFRQQVANLNRQFEAQNQRQNRQLQNMRRQI